MSTVRSGSGTRQIVLDQSEQGFRTDAEYIGTYTFFEKADSLNKIAAGAFVRTCFLLPNQKSAVLFYA